ncbi:uncharacterized protein LOC111333651 [Stylophora pistillata]|uniref:uncharacterized protein LOC111333651 n=1 Tax=Stylophora pistillata TaxID=50429 RepID=UPI000C054FA0|nr:uncharacterized protein LOC111333651 [Stylophora pistillata]
MSTDNYFILNFVSVMIETGIIILFLRISDVTAADLALRQPAKISGHGESEAALAVEGTSARCAVTSLLTDPWWRVDLGRSYVVDAISILTGAHALTDFEIRIGDSLDNEGNSNQKFGGPYTTTSSQEKSFFCIPGIRGRYVNIRIAGDNKKLEICGMSVNPNPTANLALGKSASQSTVSHSAYPVRALDGNIDGRFSSSCCTHTYTTTDPWWRGDLGSSQYVSEVFIVNRVEASYRLFNIEIRVGDSLVNNGNSNPRCGGLYSMATSLKDSFYCKPRKTGRYVNIRLVGSKMILTLCEVEVYSESRAILKYKPVEHSVQDAYDQTSLTLVCPEPFGYPEPLVAWVKDGVVLQNSSSDLTLNLSIIIQRGITTWAIDCVASNKHGADYYRFILNLRSRREMCTEFRDLVEGTRTAHHVVHNQVLAQNDNDIDNSIWYRFVSPATATPVQLPDSCTEPRTCGTQASGWLRGGHPSAEEGLVNRTVCFSWNDNCCFAEVPAQVKHCYGYYVYKLQPTALEVKARYCVENQDIHHEDALFHLLVSKTGVQLALTGHVIHTEYHVTSSWKCMAYCLIEVTCVSFNYYPQSNTCELNNSTVSSNPESLREGPGTEYYERMNLISLEAGSHL